MIYTAEQFRGQARARRLLDAYLRQGKLGGCVLLLGQRGLGKTTLATVAARALCCEHRPAGAGLTFCGQCYACRSIAEGQQSEYVLIRPKGTDIKVEQMDEDSGALYSFSLHPVNMSHRILIIDEAHCLNEYTSNQMLKLLEEPPERSVFFLVTDKPERLLPTIHSRGLKITLAPEPREALMQYLNEDAPGLSVADLSETAYMSGGRYVDALLLAADGEWREAVKQLAAALAVCLGGGTGLRAGQAVTGTESRPTEAAAELASYEYGALWEKELADTGLTETEAAKGVEKPRVNELKRQALISSYERATWWMLGDSGSSGVRAGLRGQSVAGFTEQLALLKRRINGNVDAALAQTAFELALQDLRAMKA